jgi:hypothetical protein
MSDNNKQGCSINIFALGVFLSVLFSILKITNIITWSWVWVLCPLWIGFAIAILFSILALFLFVISLIFLAIGIKSSNNIVYKWRKK